MPLVSQTFDQLLDFTRTTSGTFVGSNGLIQTTPASVNLFTWTQQFDNAAWSKGNGAITANATTAPDGTATADSFVATAATAATFVQATFTSLAQSYTASFYVKANGVQYIQLLWAGTQSVNIVNFDIVNGTIGTNTADAGSITATGNGWYRVTITSTLLAAAGAISVYCIPASNSARGASYTGDGTSGVFLWGAQLEAASAATTYTRNNGGVFPPRFDYDPVTLAPKGILIEEQRTNITLYSGVTAANWGTTGGTLANTGKTSPDGTSQMGLFTEDTANSSHFIFVNTQPAVIVSGTTYTASVYLAAGTRRYVVVNAGSSGSGWGVTVDTTNWTFTNYSVGGGVFQSATLTPVGNGIYRVTVTGNQFAGGGISAYVVVGGSLVSSATRVDTAYVGTGGTFYAWGAQFEAGAFATSYIPTVASQVTRTGDFTSIVAPNFAPWYNQSEGSFVVEVSYLNASTTSLAATAYSGDPGTTNDYITYLKTSGAINRQSIVTAGVGQGNLEFAGAVAGTVYKMAGAYKVNDVAFSVNGATALTDATVTLPTPNALAIGFLFTSFLNGHVRSIRYYPTRLSNAQLQALSA